MSNHLTNQECRDAFEKWASEIEPESGYKNGNVIFYQHQYKIWESAWNARCEYPVVENNSK